MGTECGSDGFFVRRDFSLFFVFLVIRGWRVCVLVTRGAGQGVGEERRDGKKEKSVVGNIYFICGAFPLSPLFPPSHLLQYHRDDNNHDMFRTDGRAGE